MLMKGKYLTKKNKTLGVKLYLLHINNEKFKKLKRQFGFMEYICDEVQ